MDGTGASMDAQDHEGDLGGAHGESGQVVAEPDAVLPVRPTAGGTDELEFDAFLRPSAGGTSESPGPDGDLGGAHAASSRNAAEDFVADFGSAVAGGDASAHAASSGTGADDFAADFDSAVVVGPNSQLNGDIGGGFQNTETAHQESTGGDFTTRQEDFVADFESAVVGGGIGPDGDLGGAHAASSGTAPDDFVADFDRAVAGGPNGQLNGDIGGGFENSENAHQESTGGDFTSLPVRCHGDDPGSTPSLPSTSAAPGGTSQPHDDFFADFASLPAVGQQVADFVAETQSAEAASPAESGAGHRSSEGSSSIAEPAPAGEGHGGSGEPSQWAFVEQASHQEEEHLRSMSTGDLQQGALSGWSVLGTGQAAAGQAETGQTGDQIAGLGMASDESTGGDFAAMPLPSHGGGSGGPMDCEPWGISGSESIASFSAAAEGGNDPGGTPSLPSTSPAPGAAEAEDADASPPDAAFADFESAGAPLGDFGATAVVTAGLHGGAEEDPGSTPSLPSVGPDPGATQSAAASAAQDGFADFAAADEAFADFSIAATGTADAHAAGAGGAEDPGSTPSLPSTCPAPGAATDERDEAAAGSPVSVEDQDPGGTPSLPTTTEENKAAEMDDAFADFSAGDGLHGDSGLTAVGEDPGSTPSLPSISALPAGSQEVKADDDFFADFSAADASVGDSGHAAVGEDPGSTPSMPSTGAVLASARETEVDHDAFADFSAAGGLEDGSGHAAVGEDPGSTPSLPSQAVATASTQEIKVADDEFADFSAADEFVGSSSIAAGEDPGSTPSLPSTGALPASAQETEVADDSFADFAAAQDLAADSGHDALGEDPGSTPSLPSSSAVPVSMQEAKSDGDGFADFSVGDSGHAAIGEDPGSTPSLPSTSAAAASTQETEVVDAAFAEFAAADGLLGESGHAAAGEDPGSTPSLPRISAPPASAQETKVDGDAPAIFSAADESMGDSGHAAAGEDPGSTPSLPSTSAVPASVQETKVNDAFADFSAADELLGDSGHTALGEDPGSTPSLPSTSPVPSSAQECKAADGAFADFSAADKLPHDSGHAAVAAEGADVGVEDPGGTPSFASKSADPGATEDVQKIETIDDDFADFSGAAQPPSTDAAADEFASFSAAGEDLGSMPSLASTGTAPVAAQEEVLEDKFGGDSSGAAVAAEDAHAGAEELGGTGAAPGNAEDTGAEALEDDFADFSGAAAQPQTTELVGDGFADFSAAPGEDLDAGSSLPRASPEAGFADFSSAGQVGDSGGPPEPEETEFADFTPTGEDAAPAGGLAEATNDGFANFEAADGQFADFGAPSSVPADESDVKPPEQLQTEEAADDFFDNDDFADFSSAPVQAPVAEAEASAADVGRGGDDGADDEFGDFDTAASAAAPPEPAPAPSPDAGEAPDAQEAEDDDFFADDDFGGFSSAPAQEAPANSTAATGDAAGDGDDDWAFSSSSTPGAQAETQLPSGPSPEEVEAEIRGIVAEWCEKARNCEICNPLKTVPCDDSSNDAALADGTDWEDWLAQDAAIPGEAQVLLQQGVSEKRVPMVPFTSLGIMATDIHSSSRGKVRDVFFAALGKYMTLQIPKGTDPADSVKDRGFSGQLEAEAEGSERADLGSASMMAPLGSASGMSPKGTTASMVSSSAPGSSSVGGFGDNSLLGDADWGLFGGSSTSSSAPAPEPGAGASAGSSSFGMGSAGGDLLSQTFNDMGLAFPATKVPAPTQQAPQLATNFAMGDRGLLSSSLGGGDGAAGARKQNLPPKVRAFLDGLPNLNHLWSPVIVS